MPGMQFTYELTERDFIEAYAAHRKHRLVWKLVKIFLVIFFAFTAVILFGFLVKATWEHTRALMPLFVLAAGWIVLIAFFPRLSMLRQFRRQPGAHGPKTTTLDDMGAHWKGTGGSSEVLWGNYIRFVEGKNHFLFYISPVFFNILPKRAIAAEQLDDVRALLSRHVQIAK